MQRFFLPALLPKVDEIVSLAPIHRQLHSVLRVQPGVQIIVLDNEGQERLMEILSVERRDTTARVAEIRPAPAEPAVAVTLYQCLLKTDKFEWILQKATELGVAAIVPVSSQRTVVRLGTALSNKQMRWDAIVREAAEQSGRGNLPLVAPATLFAEAVASASGTRLLPWEEGEANPGPLAALGQIKEPVEQVSILIGPEGGLEAAEVQQAIDAGWQVVTLGNRILRAETAALAALSVVTAALGELGDAATVKIAAPKKGREKQTTARRGSEKKASAAEEVTGSDDAPKADVEATKSEPVAE